MIRAQGSKRRGSLTRADFNSMSSPVPGNIFACMEELGIEEMRQVEDEIGGRCPQHEERTGKRDVKADNWSVHAEDGYFNCFACGYRGPFVRLVRDVLGVDQADAAAWIRKRGSIERAKRQLGHGLIAEVVNRGPVDTSTQYNEAALALFTDPPAEALEKRSLSLEAAQHYGVLWDTTNDAWITPIRDPDTAKLKGWQEKNERYFRNKPKDVKKSESLFGLDVFDGGRMVVVESPLDCPRLYTAMVDGACSTYGAAVSNTQLDLIINHADSVLFALDADKAGDKQSDMLRMYFGRRGFPCKFMDYSHVTADVTDPGEMTDEEILQGIDQAYSSVVARF